MSDLEGRLDDARRLGRAALAEARPGADSDEPREYAYLLGSVEAALKILLDALDDQGARQVPNPRGREPAEGVAARAMLKDYETQMHEFVTGSRTDTDWLTWSLRLAQHMRQLLNAIPAAGK